MDFCCHVSKCRTLGRDTVAHMPISTDQHCGGAVGTNRQVCPAATLPTSMTCSHLRSSFRFREASGGPPAYPAFAASVASIDTLQTWHKEECVLSTSIDSQGGHNSGPTNTPALQDSYSKQLTHHQVRCNHVARQSHEHVDQLAQHKCHSLQRVFADNIARAGQVWRLHCGQTTCPRRGLPRQLRHVNNPSPCPPGQVRSAIGRPQSRPVT